MPYKWLKNVTMCAIAVVEEAILNWSGNILLQLHLLIDHVKSVDIHATTNW